MLYRLHHRECVNASVEETWNVITEHEQYRHWTHVDYSIEVPGKPERNGLGGVRSGDLTGEKKALSSE